MTRDNTVLALALSFTLGLAQIEATGAATTPSPTPKHLVELAKQAKVVESGQSIEAAVSGAEADIRTGCSAQDTEKDLKIDAVLIAKSILTACKGQIARVKVTFSCGTQNDREVVVTQGDVLAFGSGQMSEKDLFSSLALTEVGKFKPQIAAAMSPPPSPLRVSAGPWFFERYAALRQIDALKNAGHDVSQFQETFDKVESDVKARDGKAAKEKLVVLQGQLIQAGASPLASPGPPGPPGGPPPVSPWFPMARFQVGNKIRQMKSQGQDVSAYHKEMQHLNHLVQERRTDEANQLLKHMQAELGLLKSDQ